MPQSEAWFTFACATGSFRVLLRRLSPTAVDRLRKPCLKMERGQETVDLKKWLAVLADKVILNWEGIQDETGGEWPCSTENKMQLLGELSDFGKFINETLIDDDSFRGNADGGPDSSTAGVRQPA
jgi:hypothetical protein